MSKAHLIIVAPAIPYLDKLTDKAIRTVVGTAKKVGQCADIAKIKREGKTIDVVFEGTEQQVRETEGEWTGQKLRQKIWRTNIGQLFKLGYIIQFRRDAPAVPIVPAILEPPKG